MDHALFLIPGTDTRCPQGFCGAVPPEAAITPTLNPSLVALAQSPRKYFHRA